MNLLCSNILPRRSSQRYFSPVVDLQTDGSETTQILQALSGLKIAAKQYCYLAKKSRTEAIFSAIFPIPGIILMLIVGTPLITYSSIYSGLASCLSGLSYELFRWALGATVTRQNEAGFVDFMLHYSLSQALTPCVARSIRCLSWVRPARH